MTNTKKLCLSIYLMFIFLTVTTLTGAAIPSNSNKGIPAVIQPTTVSLKRTHISHAIRYRGDINDFIHRMGMQEGRGVYDTVSSRGYLGMYQFHTRTLAGIGITVSKREFLNNPVLQDSAMILLMQKNSRILNKVIRARVGTYHNGVYLTKSGLLAGAHLVGPGGVLAWLYPDKFSYKTVDGNGVTVDQYVRRFGGYDLQGI